MRAPVAAAAGVALPESRLRALDLAASTAEEALNWDDKAAAARILSQAADLLWDNYPERSRTWLTSAWGMTSDVSAVDTDEVIRRFRSTSPRSAARTVVLNVARKHDREFADGLLARLADEKEQDSGNVRRGVFDDRSARSEQLLNMALAFAENDPATAAELAERSLTDGISFQLQALLLTLRCRDEAAAGRVLDAALNKLAAGFAHPSEGQVLASYLFTPGRVLSPGVGGTMMLAVGSQNPALRRSPADDDPARARRFLGIMQTVLLSMPEPNAAPDAARATQEYVALSGSLVNGYRRYAPDLWPPIAQRMARVGVESRRPVPAREQTVLGIAGTDEKEAERLNQEQLEEAAEKENNPAARRLAYVRAALATGPEELERGRKLAAKVDEVDLRRRLVSVLVYRAALARLEGGRVEEAVNLATEAVPMARAIVLIGAARRSAAVSTGARQASVRSQRLRALHLLSAAEDILRQDDLPEAAQKVWLGLVAALAPIDHDRALDAFRHAVTAINERSRFDFSDASAPQVVSLTEVPDFLLQRIRTGYGLKDAVSPLARADFEATVAAAARLASPTARGTCMLEIAQSVLTAEKSR